MLSLRKTKSLTPNFNKPRPACPFYGFGMPLGRVMMDTEGNQCALVRGSHSPCAMEMNGQTPDWNKCSSEDNEALIEEFDKMTEKHLRVAPKEFWPDGKSSWKGLPFKTWKEYVMGNQVERPSVPM